MIDNLVIAQRAPLYCNGCPGLAIRRRGCSFTGSNRLRALTHCLVRGSAVFRAVAGSLGPAMGPSGIQPQALFACALRAVDRKMKVVRHHRRTRDLRHQHVRDLFRARSASSAKRMVSTGAVLTPRAAWRAPDGVMGAARNRLQAFVIGQGGDLPQSNRAQSSRACSCRLAGNHGNEGRRFSGGPQRTTCGPPPYGLVTSACSQ